MGRNKNKASNARQSNKRHAGGGGKAGTPTRTAASGSGRGLKKDAGLPAYFKQRRQAHITAAAADAARQEDTSSPLDISDTTKMDTEAEAASSSVATWSKRYDVGEVAVTTDTFERAARDLALSGKRDNSAKAFMREVKNVIENSDVLLSVLDARDPLGSRSKQTELLAMEHGKRVVLVLNKVDLIPTSNLQAWLRYLRNDFPTLAFKASTQQQRTHLKQGRGQVDLPSSTATSGKLLSFGSEAIGATALLQLLKNYARTAVKGSSVKQQLTVGVVGPPNVGKSSLINSLLRTRACAVASTPGWTKVVQGVMLEKGIRLLDCPGVVLGGGSGDDEDAATHDDVAWNVLRNTVKVELIEDPIAPIQAMLARVDAEQLIRLYSIEGGFNEGDANDFLLRVALMRGKLGKGGVPDLDGAARIVLHDWNIGRISFHSQPPAVHRSLQQKEARSTSVADSISKQMTVSSSSASEMPAAALTAGSSLVTHFSEAFDLEALLSEADAEAFDAKANTAAAVSGANGRDLITPRERVYAKALSGVEAIEEDEDIDTAIEPSLSALDTSRSSLGKRRRSRNDITLSDDENGDSSDSSSDDDEDALQAEDDDSSAFTHHISASIEAPDNAASPSRGRSAQLRDPAVKRETILSRQQRELQRAMGEYEVAGMARRRSDVRRAAKKSRKRVRKSGAGLVDVMASALALHGDEADTYGDGRGASDRVEEGNDSCDVEHRRRGLFEVLDPKVNTSLTEQQIQIVEDDGDDDKEEEL